MNILLDVPNITDWMQAGASIVGAFGAVIAIIASIISFVNLKKDNLANQRAISSLIDLSQETRLQTAELVAQSRHLSDLNGNFSQYLAIATNNFTIQNLEKQEEKQLQNKLRKSFIMPRLATRSGSSSDANNTKLALVNRGESGKILSYSVSPLTEEQFYIDNSFINKFIDKDQILDIFLSTKQPYNSNSGSYQLSLVIKDIDGNQYTQSIVGLGPSFEIDYPIEVASQT